VIIKEPTTPQMFTTLPCEKTFVTKPACHVLGQISQLKTYWTQLCYKNFKTKLENCRFCRYAV